MAVFLKILAIIGIILLSILGIILLAILLVLFVPVRYKAEGVFKDNKPSFSARVSWLLHILSVIYTYGDKDPLTIRIFGIRLKSKKKDSASEDFDDDFIDDYVSPAPIKPAEIKQDATADSPSITVGPSEITDKPEETVTDIKTSSDVTEKTPIHEEPSHIFETQDSDLKSEDTNVDEDDFKPSQDKKTQSSNKDFENHSFYDKIKKCIEIIESRRFKKAFEYSKNKIFKLLKHIRPRKIDVNGEVGFDDPSVTGKILVITSILIPVYGKNFRIVGNFEEPIISIEGRLKGHITVFRVLWTGAVLYFNKNIRKIIKMFREVLG